MCFFFSFLFCYSAILTSSPRCSLQGDEQVDVFTPDKYYEMQRNRRGRREVVFGILLSLSSLFTISGCILRGAFSVGIKHGALVLAVVKFYPLIRKCFILWLIPKKMEISKGFFPYTCKVSRCILNWQEECKSCLPSLWELAIFWQEVSVWFSLSLWMLNWGLCTQTRELRHWLSTSVVALLS